MSKQWPEVALGDIAKPVKRPIPVLPGESYRTIGVKWWGEGAYERQTIDGSRTAAKTLSLVRTGDLIINKIWVRHGSTAIASGAVDGCAASGEFPTFELNTDRVVPGWIHWQTKTRGFWSKCDELSRGTSGKNRIKPELFLTVRVPLPPLLEQRRVVAKLDALAAKIEEARSLRHQAAEEAEALLESTTSAVCYNSRHRQTTLGHILIDAKNGIYKPPIFWGAGRPCVRMYNIEGPAMNTANLQCLDVTEDEWDTYRCELGDLVFNRVNSAELVGKTGLISETYPPCTFESKNMRLRLDRTQAMPEFFARILNSSKTREYYRHSLKQQCGMATLNQGHVRNIPCPLPPLSEQCRIVAYLDGLQTQVDALKRLQAETATELAALLPSILDKAFKGEL